MVLAQQGLPFSRLGKLGLAALAAAATTASADEPTDPELKTLFDQHNLHRCQHGVPPLRWNNTLADGARQWAIQGELQTSDLPVGENLIVGRKVSGLQATEHWYDEVYEWKKDGNDKYTFSPATGHFTQMVWKATTQIGCGKSTNTVKGMNQEDLDFWVCRYYPEGNLVDHFKENLHDLNPQAHCTHGKEPEERVKWQFGTSQDSCFEKGELLVRHKDNSLINVMGYGLVEYEVLGVEVYNSKAGLPLGSIKNGSYTWTVGADQTATQTFMQVTVVTQDMKFTGRSTDTNGNLRVNASGKILQLGHGQGGTGNSCAGTFYFQTEKIQQKSTLFQLFGTPVFPGSFQIGVGIVSCALLFAMAAAICITRRLRQPSTKYEGVKDELQMSMAA